MSTKFLINSKTGRRIPHANLSRFHPDFGMTMAEHAVRKANRAAGRIPFEAVETRRAKDKMTPAGRAMSA